MRNCSVGGGEDAFNARPDRRNLEDSLRQRGYVLRHNAAFGIYLDGSRPFIVFSRPDMSLAPLRLAGITCRRQLKLRRLFS